MAHIPFNKPTTSGNELKYLELALQSNKFSGEGEFNKRCTDFFKSYINCLAAFLTPSCTSALEMAMLIIDLKPGEEVIMPSFTFTSTATSVLIRNGVPVFIDCRPETMNLNEDLVESAITSKTKAIMPMYYGGASCDMKKIMQIAGKHNLVVVVDAAQAIGAKQDELALESLGHLSALSFHETKNINCGEGGALFINDKRFLHQAEIIRDKGTNRKQFIDGLVDKYSWQDIGSSYLVSEFNAAVLLSQLEQLEDITQHRREAWLYYHTALEVLEKEGLLVRPKYHETVHHNGHLYFIILKDEGTRVLVQQYLKAQDITAAPHYVPLHSSHAGKRFGRDGSAMDITNDLSFRLLRLPIFHKISKEQQDYVINKLKESLRT